MELLHIAPFPQLYLEHLFTFPSLYGSSFRLYYILCKNNLFPFVCLHNLLCIMVVLQVIFRLVMFRPFEGEILEGKIEKSGPDGLHCTLYK